MIWRKYIPISAIEAGDRKIKDMHRDPIKNQLLDVSRGGVVITQINN